MIALFFSAVFVNRKVEDPLLNLDIGLHLFNYLLFQQECLQCAETNLNEVLQIVEVFEPWRTTLCRILEAILKYVVLVCAILFVCFMYGSCWCDSSIGHMCITDLD